MDKNTSKSSTASSSESESVDSDNKVKGSLKKTYKKPELVSHGSLSDLTKFGGSSPLFDFFARRF